MNWRADAIGGATHSGDWRRPRHQTRRARTRWRPPPAWSWRGRRPVGRTAERPEAGAAPSNPAGRRRRCCLAGEARSRPPAEGGARAWRYSLLDLSALWGGTPPLWETPPPPMYFRWGRRQGDRYKTGARRRPLPRSTARQRPSLLSRRPSLPPRRGRCRSTIHGRIAAKLFFMRRYPCRLVSVQAPAFVSIPVHFIQDSPRKRGRQPGDYLGDPV